MQGLAGFFQHWADSGGPNFSIIYDSFDRQRFLLGLWTTIELSVASIVFSVVLGLAGAWVLAGPSRAGHALVRGYVQFFRNTPPLVQLSFFYFAVGGLMPGSHGGGGPLVTGFGWAVISFSLFAGAFNVEIFRSGIEAVPHATVEAAQSLGYRGYGLYRHILVPLGLRICLPALTNNMVNLVKTTTLAYAIGVPDLLYAASQIWSEVLNVREMMIVLLVTYLILVAILVWMMEGWERSLTIPGHMA
jgi:polar amino acid transport system permease protein